MKILRPQKQFGAESHEIDVEKEYGDGGQGQWPVRKEPVEIAEMNGAGFPEIEQDGNAKKKPDDYEENQAETAAGFFGWCSGIRCQRIVSGCVDRRSLPTDEWHFRSAGWLRRRGP